MKKIYTKEELDMLWDGAVDTPIYGVHFELDGRIFYSKVERDDYIRYGKIKE